MTACPIRPSSNFVDTVTVGSLTGTPITTASGFSVSTGAVRTDLDRGLRLRLRHSRPAGTGRKVFLPRAVLGIDLQRHRRARVACAGARPSTTSTPRRSNGYVTDVAVPVALGERYVVRSRVVCDLGVPIYAKVEIIGFDDNSAGRSRR